MLNEEQRKIALAIALRTEKENYNERVIELILQALRGKTQEEATMIFDFWVTYRPWTNKLARELVKFADKEVPEPSISFDLSKTDVQKALHSLAEKSYGEEFRILINALAQLEKIKDN